MVTLQIFRMAKAEPPLRLKAESQKFNQGGRKLLSGATPVALQEAGVRRQSWGWVRLALATRRNTQGVGHCCYPGKSPAATIQPIPAP